MPGPDVIRAIREAIGIEGRFVPKLAIIAVTDAGPLAVDVEKVY
jgi:hypothetical protein